MSPDVLREINALATEYRLQGLTPNAGEIYKKLAARPDLVDLPTDRTIRNIVRAPSRETATAWRPTSSTVDATLVLPTLARVIEHTRGGRTQLTTREAELIAAIAEAGRLSDPLQAYYLALDYIEAEERGDDRYVALLDARLAFAPWTSEDARRRYELLVEREWLAYPLGIGRGRGATVTGRAFVEYRKGMTVGKTTRRKGARKAKR